MSEEPAITPEAAAAAADPPANSDATPVDAAPEIDLNPAGAAQPAPGGAVPAAVPDCRTTDIVPGPGGVMTDEVGVVTGELTLRSEYGDGRVTLRVQYKDADEWYVVTGGQVALADPAGLSAVHEIAVALLDRPEG